MTAGDLAISKTIITRENYLPNTLVTYRIDYSNLSPILMTGIIIQDVLPNTLSFVSANPSPIDSDAMTWNLDDLQAYSSGTITVIARIN